MLRRVSQATPRQLAAIHAAGGIPADWAEASAGAAAAGDAPAAHDPGQPAAARPAPSRGCRGAIALKQPSDANNPEMEQEMKHYWD